MLLDIREKFSINKKIENNILSRVLKIQSSLLQLFFLLFILEEFFTSEVKGQTFYLLKALLWCTVEGK